jgi:SnoaL-like domain
MNQDVLQDSVDTVSIQRLIAAYADMVTRRVWSELSDVFAPDAAVVLDLRNNGTMTIDGPAQLGEFVGRSLEQFDFFEFVVLNLHIMLHAGGDSDRATGRLWMSEIRQFASNGMWSTIHGLYRDEYARDDSAPYGWRIAGRRYQSLARTNRSVETFPIPTD